jgi:hypothetical protein
MFLRSLSQTHVNWENGVRDPSRILDATGLDSIRSAVVPYPVVFDSCLSVMFNGGAKPLPFPHWRFG